MLCILQFSWREQRLKSSEKCKNYVGMMISSHEIMPHQELLHVSAVRLDRGIHAVL